MYVLYSIAKYSLSTISSSLSLKLVLCVLVLRSKNHMRRRPPSAASSSSEQLKKNNNNKEEEEEEERRRRRHQRHEGDTWAGAAVALLVGLAGSVGLALYAVNEQGVWTLGYPTINYNPDSLPKGFAGFAGYANGGHASAAAAAAALSETQHYDGGGGSPRNRLAAHAYLGYGLLAYHLTMVLARAVIKGPEELYNQLWACNTGMALATAGMCLHRPVLVGAAVGVVAIDQVLWYFDVLLKLTTGKYAIGVARYLDWPETPFVQKVFSWHHLWFLPVCTYYLRATGPGMPPGALRLAVLGVFSMTLLSRWLTPRRLNINMCFEFWKDIKIAPLHVCDGAPFYVYVPWILVVFNAINLPLWPAMVWLAGGWERVCGGGGGSHSVSS